MIYLELQTLLKHPDIRFDAAPTEDYFVVDDAATGQALAWVKASDQAEVEAAIARSAIAQDQWQQQTALARADILLAWHQLILQQREGLAQILTAEQGKSLAEARGEIAYAASFIRWFAEQARRVDGSVLTPVQSQQRLIVLKQAIGVTAAITPWNFPAAMITRKIAPALAVGCSMLVKPAEQTPLIAAQAVQMLWEAGVPHGAVQLLPGRGETVGAQLSQDDRIQGIMFTGSTEVAKILQKTVAKRLSPNGQPIPLIAETGGQNAMIVDSSALTEQVVLDVVSSAFDSAGQRCSALRILCVQEDSAATVIKMLKGAMQQLIVGNPAILKTDIGPVIDTEAKQTIDTHSKDEI